MSKKKIEMIQVATNIWYWFSSNKMNKIEPYTGKKFFKKKDKKLSIVNPPLQSEVGGVKENFFI